MVQLSSVDVCALVAECSLLKGAKLETVYGVGEGFVFRFYAKKHIDLYVQPPKWFYLTKKEDDANPATTFVSKLRSLIDGSTVVDILQPGFNRVVLCSLKRKDQQMNLYFELFDKGNIVLTDSTNTIICVESVQKWAIRTVDVNQKYVVEQKPFPHELSIPQSVDDTQLQQFLVKDCSLGTWYATQCMALHHQSKESIQSILHRLCTTCKPTVYFSVELTPQRAKHISVLDVHRDEFLVKSFETLSQSYQYCHVKPNPLQAKLEQAQKKIQAKIDQQKKVLVTADEQITQNYAIANYITQNAPLIDEYIQSNKHHKTIKFKEL
jgi:predicted ribosome quality control (RQC) complex YloA/Tae2 family protein